MRQSVYNVKKYGLVANNNVQERTTLNTLKIAGHIFGGLIKLLYRKFKDLVRIFIIVG